MSLRATLLLGMFLVIAALVHGGIYSAGHDFVVNRFTGTFEFVPAEGEEDDAGLPVVAAGHVRALTCTGPGARVPRLVRVRRANSVGR
jgi:hypothetical protein